ncbi:MAG: FAD-dependent oxidoreductase [Pseudomonadota bacterium]
MQVDVLIVGGGLAGLSLAQRLEQKGIDYLLLEARDRLGGRILTKSVGVNGNTGSFDLGPAWFWPGQPRIAALVRNFELEVFDQYSAGELTFEDEAGRVVRGQGFASMEGSLRLAGGMGALIERLRDCLPSDRIRLDRPVTRLSPEGREIVATAEAKDGAKETINASQVVLAIPPRVAADTIDFLPEMPSKALKAMRQVPTWMAGHAKIVAVYERPFWREAGLSGDAMSHRGPMVEIHDASPPSGGPYALFGFVGTPPGSRRDNADRLIDLARVQLGRLFGEQTARPSEIMLQDWAFEPATSTALDLTPLQFHPTYGTPRPLANIWEGRLILASTETAAQFGGYLEGALEASDNAFERIKTFLASLPNIAHSEALPLASTTEDTAHTAQ